MGGVTCGMDEAEVRPRAVLALVHGSEHAPLGPVFGSTRCDLGFVEDLLRLQLVARRFGWSIRLTQVRPDLLELVDLVGLTTDLVD